MKTIQNLFLASTLVLGSQVALAEADSVLIEVGVQRVFVPLNGYDDNDTVEVVIDGYLPNSCYTLEQHVVERNAEDNSFSIKQYAVQQMGGLCAESNSEDPRLTTLVPYTNTIVLGKVDAGSYKVEFTPDRVSTQNRAFNVTQAPVTTIDTLPYAMVTNVQISDLVQSGNHIAAEISGTLNNSCYHFNDTVRVEKVDDVLVVLPTITVDMSQPCLMFVRTFSKTVDLGAYSADRYLLHVRSMNGKSLNRVFSVVDAVN
ncbi:hypothetical protein GW915_05895 [bacterium]|nr:hypothetical protein [bacterium]